MKLRIAVVGMGALLAPITGPAAGQSVHPAPGITLSAGGVVHTPFQRHDLLVFSPDQSDPERLRRQLRAETSASYGLAMSVWIWPTVGVRAALSRVPTRFRVELQEAGGGQLPPDGAHLGAGEFGKLNVWLLDAALMLRLPATTPGIVPYLLLGGGATAYRVGADETLPPGSRAAFPHERALRAAGVFGGGALASLKGDRLALRFELTNHLTATPIREVEDGRWNTPEGLTLELGEVEGEGALDRRVYFTNHVRLSLGMSVGLGGSRLPR